MPRYKYTSNKDSQDGTEVVVLKNGERLKQGDEAELTEEEAAELRGRFNLREVEKGSERGSEGEASAQGGSWSSPSDSSSSSQKAPRG